MLEKVNVKKKNEAIIKIDDLHKYYNLEGKRKIHILKGINAEINASDFVIIYGSSGSGKSTLLNHIVGLESPTSGNIKILGQDVGHMSKEQRAILRSQKIGMVYQIWYWVKSLNVLDNVSIPLLLQGYDTIPAREKAYEMLDIVMMSKFADKSPLHLSGGEQQRICLARALVNNPWIIVADEPTGNLDTHNSDQIMKVFQDLNRKQKRTVIMVTHNLSYLPIANKTIAIKDGQVVTPDNVKEEEKVEKAKEIE